MSTFVEPNHPVQKLVFFLAQDADELTRTTVKSFVASLASLREWIIEPPSKITDENDPSLVGGCIKIYSALPPNVLPLDIDLKHFEEVDVVISALKRFSYEHMLAFEFELDGKFVGAVEDGNADRNFQVGLLGEWKKQLDARK